MTTSVLTPKTIGDLVKLAAKYGKRAFFVSGVDPASEKIPSGKVVIDLTNVDSLNEISAPKDRVVIGTGVNLGKLAREITGESSLIRQAATIIANPLVSNKIILAQALVPESPYFDITTPMVLLESKVRTQSPTSKRTLNIRDFLEAVADGLKKGELPTAIEFTKLPAGERVGFFRVARMGGKGTVSAAARMKIQRNTCLSPEIVVSSLTLIPLRSKAAEKEIAGKVASEEIIKKASQVAAQEIGELAEKANAYERTLVEITVSRTLRSIMEGSISA
jgi:CO/xanthine dehydrogenase FAD-binding subunit